MKTWSLQSVKCIFKCLILPLFGYVVVWVWMSNGSFGSGALASCHWKVAGLIPLVCVLKCPWAGYWTPKAPDVLVGTLHDSHHHQCMNVWITVSRFGQKRLLKCPKKTPQCSLPKRQKWPSFTSFIPGNSGPPLSNKPIIDPFGPQNVNLTVTEYTSVNHSAGIVQMNYTIEKVTNPFLAGQKYISCTSFKRHYHKKKTGYRIVAVVLPVDVLTASILTCQRRKSTGVTSNVNNPFY